MLAVIRESTANVPDELKTTSSGLVHAISCGSLFYHLSNIRDRYCRVLLPNCDISYFAYDKQVHLSWSYAENGQMNCLFRGNILNVNDLKHRYGLEALADEKSVIFAMYKSITSAEVSPDSVLKELTGIFAFVLYDAACKYIFLATDSEGKVPFFWGTSPDGPLIVCDKFEMMKKGCGNSFARFPKCCFFMSRDCSIRNFSHPTKKLKPTPFIYEKTGEQLGVTFVIDEESEETSSSGSK
ncbi:unnamed protein product [Rhodiola kirilowii]